MKLTIIAAILASALFGSLATSASAGLTITQRGDQTIFWGTGKNAGLVGICRQMGDRITCN